MVPNFYAPRSSWVRVIGGDLSLATPIGSTVPRSLHFGKNQTKGTQSVIVQGSFPTLGLALTTDHDRNGSSLAAGDSRDFVKTKKIAKTSEGDKLESEKSSANDVLLTPENKNGRGRRLSHPADRSRNSLRARDN